MEIATIILTAPRPKKTLDRTCESLRQAGFSGFAIYNDHAQSGHFRAYMAALGCVADRFPRAEAYFLVEDDVVFCRSLHDYLQRTLWPEPAERIALCSPYCPKVYRQKRAGWNAAQSGRGFYLAGSQAWIFPAPMVRAILVELAALPKPHNADAEIGKWAKAGRRRIWYHTPSLAQHVGLGNSALGDNLVSDLRFAADFLGEDADALAQFGKDHL